MKLSHFARKLGAILILCALVIPVGLLVRVPAPAFALRDPCALDPNNVIYNGSMGPEHDTPYGSASDGWNPFIFDGAPPRFRWVGNEQIDPNGSQQVFSTNTFDAGVQQTVKNLQPGVYYWVRWGYSLAAKSYDGPNVRVESIGRKLGVDPTGGTDPHSPNVVWGPDYFDGKAALNIPAMTMVFAARSANATIFLRAMARDGSSGENRVWIDAICMEARPDMPTATPPPATATPVPPTATVRPTLKPTLKPNTPAPTPTRVRTATPVAMATPMASQTEQVVEVAAKLPDPPKPTQVAEVPQPAVLQPTMRFARPVVAERSSMMMVDSGLFAGMGFGSIIGSFVMFALGLVLVRRRD